MNKFDASLLDSLPPAYDADFVKWHKVLCKCLYICLHTSNSCGASCFVDMSFAIACLKLNMF
jgi:hypothetical protein